MKTKTQKRVEAILRNIKYITQQEKNSIFKANNRQLEHIIETNRKLNQDNLKSYTDKNNFKDLVSAFVYKRNPNL